MKNYFLLISLLLFVVLFSIISCDNNDNNDPNVPCNALFFQLISDTDGSSNATFNIFDYQKSTTLNFNNTNPQLTNDESFVQQNVGLRFTKSAIDDSSTRIVYKMADMFISYQNGVVTQTTFPNGDLRNNPEFINGDLYFIKPNSILSTASSIEITNETGNVISSTFNVNLSNSGIINTYMISSTSDKTSTIYYLANKILLRYNVISDTMTTMQINTLNNNMFYFGIEYVDSNTLYALQGSLSNQSLKLVKIDISNTNNPVVSTLMDLTNSPSLSFNPHNMVDLYYAYVQTDYDSCDNSYYFSYTDPGNTNSKPYFVELKLNSNTINEYYNNALDGKYYFGLDHLR